MHETLIIHPGSGRARGRLARSTSVTVFCADDSPVTRSLVGWCRVAGQGAATDAIRDLTALGEGADVGEVCAIITHPDRTHTVLVHGGLPITIDPAPSTEVRCERGQWVVHRLHSDLDQVTIELLPADAPLDVSLSLDSGIVPAEGFVWKSATTDVVAPCSDISADLDAAACPPTPMDPEAIVEFVETGSAPLVTVARLVPLGVDGELPPPAPLPVRSNESRSSDAECDAPVASLPSSPRAVRIPGLHCSRGHFNDPRARFCALCGIAMHQTSFVMTQGDRPPLGVLVFNDGSYHTLLRTLIIGRMPDHDTEVRAERSDACVLVDPGNTISRVHAEMRAAGWDVHLIDRESSNGTFIWSTERNQWDRLVAHRPVLLTAGTTVAFGGVTATFESANLQKQ